MINSIDISYADLEKLGWPQSLIDDYQGIKRDLVPQHGEEADPNGVYSANSNGLYIKTNAPTAIWFNPTRGEFTGWVQIA